MALGEWEFKPEEILSSKRKVKGIFHKAVVDKDNEFITPDAIKKSIPDFMHLPALHDFHKERPVGLATKIWENKDGSFGFEGVIKATEDADDVWEKISKGNYDHVSIFGRRTEGNQNCSLPQGLRTGPCITNGVRLDSISVCDDNARNDSTSLAVAKAQLIWDGMDMIKKAETAGESNLMHTPTDYAKKCPCSKKKYKVVEKSMSHPDHRIPKEDDGRRRSDDPDIDRNDPRGVAARLKHRQSEMYKGEKWSQKEKNEAFDKLEREHPGAAAELRQHERGGEKGKRQYFNKGDEEDDDMSDEEAPQMMEKGQWEGGVAEVHSHDVRHHTRSHHGKPKRGEGGESEFKERDTTATSKPAPKKEKERAPTSGVKYDKMQKGEDDDSAPSYAPSDYSNKHANQLQRQASDDNKWVKEGLKKDVKKGDVSEEDADDDNQYDEESDSSKKKVSPKDKEGQWSKDKDPNGSVKVKKAEKEQEIDTETRGEDAKEEMDEDDEDEEVDKAFSRAGRMATAHVDLKNKRLKPGQQDNDRIRHEVRADVNRKMAIKKGDTMEEDEVSQEYVTKAMVPIEEVDTIVKARTEEISKAYTVQFDEIKKANLAAIDEVKKAYDAKIAELTTRVDKMGEETIRKGGSIVVIPQLLDPENKGFGSNADALAKISAGK